MTTSAHVLETAIYVDDLDAAEAFYDRVFAFEKVRREGDRHVFYRCGPGMLLVFNPAATERAAPPGALPIPPHGARGPGHLCLAAEPLGIEGWRERLARLGVAIEREIRWPRGGLSLYFRDPAGNSLEVAEARLWAPAKDG
jgi:catechol 2,3-dioxygenase-like lactoylglutathione lyase family enzyme